MEKKFAVKTLNADKQEKNRLCCLDVICFRFCFVSWKRSGENVIRNVNNSFESAKRAFKRFCNVYFGTFC